MSLRKQSLEVRNKVKEKLNEITGFSFGEEYNDLYGRKDGYEVRLQFKSSLQREIRQKYKP